MTRMPIAGAAGLLAALVPFAALAAGADPGAAAGHHGDAHYGAPHLDGAELGLIREVDPIGWTAWTPI